MRWLHAVGLITLVACGGSEDTEVLRQERDALEGRVASLKKELEATKRELAMAKKAPSDKKPAATKRPPAEAVAKAREALGLDEGQTLHATFKTSLGDVPCELWPDIAPVTVTNFVGLAEGTKPWTDPRTGETREGEALYDGTVFHRVIKDFMIQGGDPLGSGRGGPGYRFEDEVWPDVRFDKQGLLAMANAGPNTNGSQFFITTSTPKHLNMRHTIFGECALETVKKIAGVEVGGPQRSTPVEPVVVETVAIERK